MKFEAFISQYDVVGTIVLLEGKREVRPEDEQKLFELGKLLALSTTNMTFRSGGASGSDELFSNGVCAVAPERLHVILPYAGHRKSVNKNYNSISLDEISLAAEPEAIYHSRSNKKTEKLVDQFVAGEKNRFTVKAAYIIRDSIKAVGANGIKPATVGIFYDDLNNPRTGGTGHTMTVCLNKNIPVIDQQVWFQWLKGLPDQAT
ncbi:MAG: hypothetical protein ACKOYP_13160 [Bacteroidota bacterium]